MSLLLTFGAGHLREPLLWGPTDIEAFLLDWAPRHVVMDGDDRAALPGVLARWVPYALGLAGVVARHHEAVMAAVRECTPQFEAAYGGASDTWPRRFGDLLPTL